MVGLPLRDRCHTCRKRKIKCDGTRPSCRQCLDNSKVCQGYPEALVFINTPPNRSNKSAPQTLRRSCHAAARLKSIVHVPATESIAPEPSLTWLRSYDALLGEFLDNCIPAHASMEVPLGWLRALMSINKQVDALPLAMSALAVGWAGHIRGYDGLVHQGLQIYSFAASQLRIESPYPGQTQFLATTVILAIYELFEFGCESNKGWVCHAAGITTALRIMGPGRVSEPLCLQIFSFVRTLFTIQSLKNRKRACAAASMWTKTPFEHSDKSDYQRLLDLGLEIGETREKASRLHEAGNGHSQEGIRMEAIHIMNQMCTQLKALDEWELSSQTSMASGPAASIMANYKDVPESKNRDTRHGYPSRVSDLDPASYDELQSSRMLGLYWSIRLSLYSTMINNDQLRKLLRDTELQLSPNKSSKHAKRCTTEAFVMMDACRMANNITDQSAFCYQSLWQSFGSMSAQWSLDTAIQWYQGHGADIPGCVSDELYSQKPLSAYKSTCQAHTDKLAREPLLDQLSQEFQQAAFGNVDVLSLPWCLINLPEETRG